MKRVLQVLLVLALLLGAVVWVPATTGACSGAITFPLQCPD
jgi:hypothetical protein